MTGEGEPQVSWKAVERDAQVVAADGTEVGKVAEVAGDPDAHIFNGLVVSVGRLQANRYLPAERVAGIWPHRVEVDASPDEIASLPSYREPVAERWAPRDAVTSRWKRLFGSYRRR